MVMVMVCGYRPIINIFIEVLYSHCIVVSVYRRFNLDKSPSPSPSREMRIVMEMEMEMARWGMVIR